MPYGMTIKKPPCTSHENGKHRWEWLRNGVKRTSYGGSLGTAVHIQAKGIYACACGKQRYGNVKPDAPGADVRDHVGPLS